MYGGTNKKETISLRKNQFRSKMLQMQHKSKHPSYLNAIGMSHEARTRRIPKFAASNPIGPKPKQGTPQILAKARKHNSSIASKSDTDLAQFAALSAEGKKWEARAATLQLRTGLIIERSEPKLDTPLAKRSTPRTPESLSTRPPRTIKGRSWIREKQRLGLEPAWRRDDLATDLAGRSRELRASASLKP